MFLSHITNKYLSVMLVISQLDYGITPNYSKLALSRSVAILAQVTFKTIFLYASCIVINRKRENENVFRVWTVAGLVSLLEFALPTHILHLGDQVQTKQLRSQTWRLLVRAIRRTIGFYPEHIDEHGRP